MEITYGGGSSFRLLSEPVIVLNPEQKVPVGEIALHSTRQRSARRIVNGPGEYEISGVLIATLPLGASTERRLAHVIHVEGVNVLFVDGPPGGLGERVLAEIGAVDVLIVRSEDVPAARELVATLSPRVVVPFGGAAPAVCAALGVPAAEPIARLKLGSKGPKAVLLKAPGRRKAA